MAILGAKLETIVFPLRWRHTHCLSGLIVLRIWLNECIEVDNYLFPFKSMFNLSEKNPKIFQDDDAKNVHAGKNL